MVQPPALMLEGSPPSATPAAQDLKPLASSGTWSHLHMRTCLHIVKNKIRKPFECVLLDEQDASEDKVARWHKERPDFALRTHMLKGQNGRLQAAL